MYKVMIFLHVVGAVGMGIYAILPFIVGKFKQLSGAAQEGFASGLVSAGRFGQYALVLQLITGGYLLTNGEAGDYAVSWIVTVSVLFLAIGALTGIAQGPLKRIVTASASAQNASGSISKVQSFSAIIFVLFLFVLWFMKNPWFAA
ncbi:hypothetical protein [Cohnella sp. GCM10027633]|uniref:hypothetical protein n=1 Tax=unclassified Cohnella TaxID=2636738 RepID=UPI00362D5930